MKSFVGHIINKAIKATPRSKKVSPDIKSVKPNLKKQVQKLEVMNIEKDIKL